jgi:hypothetical protein
MSAARPGDVDRGEGIWQTPAGFLYCEQCGSLVMEGLQAEHSRLHPRIDCTQFACGVFHPEGHAWLEQFRSLAPSNAPIITIPSS